MFKTKKKEGLISTGLENIFIWVDEKGFSNSLNNDDEAQEPRNVGEYKNADEMLKSFKVDGELFADVVLPYIHELSHVLYC